MRVIRRLISLNLKRRSTRNIPLLIIRQKSDKTLGAKNRNRNYERLTCKSIMVRGRMLIYNRRTLRATNRCNRAKILLIRAQETGRTYFKIRRQIKGGTRANITRHNANKSRINSGINRTRLRKELRNTIRISNFNFSAIFSRMIVRRLIRNNNRTFTLGIFRDNSQKFIQDHRTRYKKTGTRQRILRYNNTKVLRRVLSNSTRIGNATARMRHSVRQARMRRLSTIIFILSSRLAQVNTRAMTNLNRRIPHKF